MKETRYRQVERMNPENFKKLVDEAQRHVKERYSLYEQLAQAMLPSNLLPDQDKEAPKAKA